MPRHFWCPMLAPDFLMASRCWERCQAGFPEGRNQVWDKGKAAARLRAPQVNMQLAAGQGSVPGQQVGLSHPELSRRPSEWLQPRLETITLNSPRHYRTQTSSKEKNSNLSPLLCIFLWLSEVWLEHSFFTLALHVHVVVNIVPSVRFFHKQIGLGSLYSNLLFCTLVAKRT